MKKRIEILYYTLIIVCIVFITAAIWERVRADQYPVIIHHDQHVTGERLPQN